MIGVAAANLHSRNDCFVFLFLFYFPAQTFFLQNLQSLDSGKLPFHLGAIDPELRFLGVRLVSISRRVEVRY